MRTIDKRLFAITGAGALALGALGLMSYLGTPEPMPVMVGGDSQLDACAATGTALSVGVAVRAGPGDQYPVTDELVAGLPLSVCGASDDGAWREIVYATPEQPALDCGVATPLATATRYTGPCRAGWVRADSIMAVAG